MKKIIITGGFLLIGSILLSESSKNMLDSYPTVNEAVNEFIFVNQTNETWGVSTAYSDAHNMGFCDTPKAATIPAQHKAVFLASSHLEHFKIKNPTSFLATIKETVHAEGKKVFYIRYADMETTKIKVEMEA